MGVQPAKELIVYQKGYKLAMHIFEASKGFPDEERYALTSQIRRSSRSVCLTLREAWAKRRYEAHFISKLTDCDAGNNETDTSLDFCKDFQYIKRIKGQTKSTINLRENYNGDRHIGHFRESY